MRSDWPIVAAAWLITLLAATLLAAGPIYSDAVSLAGLRRVLVDAPVRDANIEATALVPPEGVEPATQEVLRLVGEAVGGVGGEVARSGRSDTYALPAQPEEGVRDLAVLGFADGLAERAELLEGTWPETEGRGPIPVAVSSQIADELGWSVGDQFHLTGRLEDQSALDIRVVGVYAIPDASAPYWWADETLTEGWTESSTYRTFGPLFTTSDELLGRVVANRVRITWHAFPHFAAIGLDQAAGLRSRVAQLPERLDFALAGAFPTSDTRLHEILEDAQRSLLVSRTGVLLLIVQLAVLAAYAIVLTAGLLAEHRQGDTALLRSRGAGPPQVALIALIEALVLAVPAAMAAPFLAAAALRVFNLAGPLAGAGVEIAPQLSSTAFIVAAGAALIAALLLVIPAFLAARSFVDEEGRRSRFETRTIGQRLGVDIALLAVTLIGLWQLRLYGAPLTQTVRGSLGLDPLLVAAPAIGLLAGGVLALRLVPLLAAAAEAVTRRGRRLVAALGTQQVARRPLRYTRAALLLMLAVSMGVFAISYADTWQSSQEDQAAYRLGADVRLVSTGGGGTVPAWSLDAALRRIDGVVEPMPVDRQFLRLPTGTSPGELLALDPAAADRVVTVRRDLVGAPLASLMQPLVDARPSPSLVTLETAPRRLLVDARLDVDEILVPEFDEATGGFRYERRDVEQTGGLRLGAEVVVRDARGILERFTGTPVAQDGGGNRIVIDLAPGTARTGTAVSEIGGGFTAPLEIVAIDLTVGMPTGTVAERGRVELVGVSASDDAEGDAWTPVAVDGAGGWSVRILRNAGPTVEPASDQVDGRSFSLAGGGPTGTLYAPTAPGIRPPAVSYVAASLPPLADASLPVVVNRAFLESTASTVGDTVTARVGGLVRTVEVVGVVEAFPTMDAEAPHAVADLATIGLLSYIASETISTPLEWWVATEPGAGEAVAEALRDGPYVRGTIDSRIETARSLSADPVALGIIGALSLGFVVAGLFAAIGLTVSAAVAARQRRTEFALLRALGLSSGQLSGWLWLENAGIVVVSLVAGTALGLLIGWVVLPFVTVTQQATSPFPPPLVVTPWLSIGLLVAISTLALGVTVLVLGRVLRRVGIGSVLRMGED